MGSDIVSVSCFPRYSVRGRHRVVDVAYRIRYADGSLKVGTCNRNVFAALARSCDASADVYAGAEPDVREGMSVQR